MWVLMHTLIAATHLGTAFFMVSYTSCDTAASCWLVEIAISGYWGYCSSGSVSPLPTDMPLRLMRGPSPPELPFHTRCATCPTHNQCSA